MRSSAIIPPSSKQNRKIHCDSVLMMTKDVSLFFLFHIFHHLRVGKDSSMILDCKKYGRRSACTRLQNSIVIDKTLQKRHGTPSCIIFCRQNLIESDKTLHHTLVVIYSIPAGGSMDDTHYDCITYKKEGLTLIMQFPKEKADSLSLIQDIRSILSAELCEQVHDILRKDG